ncbi:MAG: hypothetical protein CVU14_12060, partial [Bacteroidetes bacterium HGW-Bacteroidetes-9]
ILDPGETANLLIACSNSGHSQIGNVLSSLAISGGSSPYLTLNSTSFSIGVLAAGASGTATFNVTADAATPLGTPVDLLFEVTGGAASQYSVQQTKQVIIGLIPEFNMTNGTVTACTGLFYDSGGASAAYQSSENITETFYPAAAGSMVRMTFNSFSTESGYDYLRIYNGTSTSAPLIGTYNGSTSPGTVTAYNASGALTFNFTSDGSVTADGWEAAISCYNAATPPVAQFTASNTSPAVNSIVTFTDQSENIPTSWVWSFSPNNISYVNGTNANSQNPQVLFSNLGTYTVSLTVTNAFGNDTEIKTNYITVTTCTYCTTSYSNTADDHISNVQLNTINNPSGSTTYSNFTSISTTLVPGQTYTASVSVTVNGSWVQHCFIWIDFNNNCSFTDAGEVFDLGQTPGTAGTHILSGTITVPAGALIGTTRMRVSERYSTDPGPCDVSTYGEAEDYTIIVEGLTKTLNLTVLLEGLYDGNGTMRKAQGETGDQYPGNTADQITVELHNTTFYGLVEYYDQFVNLSTSGLATLSIPIDFNGSYYLTVRHRNSIATTSKQPVSFAA